MSASDDREPGARDAISLSGRGEVARVEADDLEGEGDVVRFSYEDEFGRSTHGVVYRWRGDLRAFENVCPHLGLPLDSHTGEFFDDNRSALVCDAHGARFDPDSGTCDMGPCEGDRLTALSVEETGEGEVVVRRERTLSR